LVEEKVLLMKKMGKKILNIFLNKPLKIIPDSLTKYALKLTDDGNTLTYTYDINDKRTGITMLLNELSKSKIELKDIQTKQTSLEDIFVTIVKE
jgi:ABC-2 type transport system ATP-binding protein